MLASSTVRLVAAAFMALAALPATGSGAPAPGQRDGVPVWVIGHDDALSPFLMRRESVRFRHVVFARFERAFAQSGLHALSEEAFRAEFDLTTAIYGPEDRWESWDFLARARRAVASGSGRAAPFIVFVRIYEREWHDNMGVLSVAIDVRLHETSSGKLIAAVGPLDYLEIPMPAACNRACMRKLVPSRAEEIFYPLAAEIAQEISQHLEAEPTPGRTE